mmetsp:Transcript_4768/g.11178  ORF Transcript_4768/g.11178 Transcript_4768/m.11178 type:complete len:114 (+) Transcript_4768:2458-2799(+)
MLRWRLHDDRNEDGNGKEDSPDGCWPDGALEVIPAMLELVLDQPNKVLRGGDHDHCASFYAMNLRAAELGASRKGVEVEGRNPDGVHGLTRFSHSSKCEVRLSGLYRENSAES